jgi:hypothetical protein
MPSSPSRRERRAYLQQQYSTALTIGGGGYGQGNQISKPASGNHPGVNPFILPKQSGLNYITQMFPNNYYVEWDLSSWRAACDQAIKMGFPVSYAALTSWVYESSPFIQSLFNAIGDAITQIPVFIVDSKGNRLENLSEEICGKRWFIELRKEILFSKFWGFTGINFDPLNNKLYKYPMQQLDPINRLLRQSTYNFSDGIDFFKTPNLLFVQPSTNYESFLGWMQPITRMFIQQNLNSMNWIQAGKRLAFPLLQIKYPGSDNSIDSDSNLSNPYRMEAENYAANVDPSKTLLTPYVIDNNGNIQSALILESQDTNAKQGAHKIYQEFNSDAKNEVREMILGGTLTGDAGKFGTKGLGEVHQDKLTTVIRARNEEVLSILNDESDFKRKLPVFYKNFPQDWKFDVNRTKEFDISEIEKLSKAATENNLRLTTKFFIKYGLDVEDIEEAPKPAKIGGNFEEDDTESLSVSIAKPKRSMFDALKKKDIY